METGAEAQHLQLYRTAVVFRQCSCVVITGVAQSQLPAIGDILL